MAPEIKMRSMGAHLSWLQVPDTPLIAAAIELARAHSSPFAFNHVMRSYLFGLIIGFKVPSLSNRDIEVHAISAILHDLGWDPTGALVSADKRFEVDGAIAARAFLDREGKSEDWDARRTQLVWDSIALHATPSIAAHKEPEVQACAYGILADFQGADVLGGGVLSWKEYDDVVRTFPGLDFIAEVRNTFCGLCREKPHATWDNFVGEFGERYVEGYSKEGKRAIDLIEGCALDARVAPVEEESRE